MAAKTTTNKVPLWGLVLAAYTPDVLKLGFRAVGLENNGTSIVDITRGVTTFVPANMPWSHGLFMTVVWSVIAAGIAYLIYRDRQTASLIGLLVTSHWLLDFVVHPPELPLLFNGSPLVGLGLWSTNTGFIISILLEAGMLVGGLVLYFTHGSN